MRNTSPLKLIVLALGCAYGLSGFAADDGNQLPAVVISATRIEQGSFDLPVSVDSLDRSRIAEGQARVNASEALASVPGLVAANRQNYAQDLQISSRGFGARSAFGVRGLRLITDGIPASMPDGQGQAATFDLDVAQRVEVMRGPYSVLYGNHAGGVIQMFSIDGTDPPSVEGRFLAGSYGTTKTGITAQGKSGRWGYVADASRFDTEGFRDHSAATRDQAFLKLGGALTDTARLTFIANMLRQKDTQDPLGLSAAALARDPRAVETAALAFDTRKSIDHLQGGVSFEQRFGRDRLTVAAYTGERSVIQYQAIPSSPAPVIRGSGGVVDFDRRFVGATARWSAVRELGDGRLTTTVGMDYEKSRDDRTGHDNLNGAQGVLRRDETDTVESAGAYLQTEWDRERWVLTGGLRHNTVKFQVEDRYITPDPINGDDSGRVDFTKPTAMLSALYRIHPSVNVYAAAARGFETPTLNELFYSGSAGAFNFRLEPATSRHLEIGAKARLGSGTQLALAIFRVKTQDEMVVDVSFNGRTSYKNAAGTTRRGMELSLDTKFSRQLSARFSYAALAATYDADFSAGGGTIPAGRRMPGVPARTAYAELAWKGRSGLSAAIEAIGRGRLYVEDSNTRGAAAGYGVVNLRAGAGQKRGHWEFSQFARVDNLFDRRYVGSVIVADSNGRYFEPASGRAWLAGVSAKYVF